ncbi:MAG: type I-G CRISPR-associated helicase/endonuclease Cas3g, partial [Acidimicrobiales bacterium]
MNDLDVGDFCEFFRLVHGDEPFVWQQQLAARALAGEWPEAVDVPTGMGKTAVIDIAVFCLAAQAERPPAERTAPMRTFAVVDRRIIVDQTYQRARRLREELMQPDRQDVVGEVAGRLLRLCAGTDRPEPLAVVRMRGGTTWDSAWLRSPAQPAVVC